MIDAGLYNSAEKIFSTYAQQLDIVTSTYISLMTVIYKYSSVYRQSRKQIKVVYG